MLIQVHRAKYQTLRYAVLETKPSSRPRSITKSDRGIVSCYNKVGAGAQRFLYTI